MGRSTAIGAISDGNHGGLQAWLLRHNVAHPQVQFSLVGNYGNFLGQNARLKLQNRLADLVTSHANQAIVDVFVE